MLDIGWSELLVIGVVALIVVGPKDLPGMFRTMGQFTGKMRRMARDFQRAMDDAADTSGMRQTAADLKSMTSAKSLGLNTLQQAADRFEKWDPAKSLKPTTPAPAPAATPAAGPATTALKTEQAAETQRRIAEARAAREAKAAAEAAAKAKAEEPVRFVPREKPGAPTASAARPKNMPRKKPAGRGRG